MKRQSKRTNEHKMPPSSGIEEPPVRIAFQQRQLVVWTNHMNAVAIFAGSFAFAAGLTLGLMNARDDARPNSVWSRLLGVHPVVTAQPEEGSLLLTSLTDPRETAPVIVLGMPRSGSLSIHNFFTCNRIESCHYCCDPTKPSMEETPRTEFPCRSDQVPCGSCVLNNMKQERPPFEGCGNYHVWSRFDVETTEPYSWFLPQHYTLPLLHDAYPGAAMILNYRGDPGVWADSVLHWHSITTRIFHSFDLSMIANPPAVPETVTYEVLVKEMQTSLDRVLDHGEHERKRELLKTVLIQHLEKVRRWARDFGHSLIEVNVDDPKAGLDLARAFHLSPDCWDFDASKLDNDWKNFTFPF